ncbi:MAG: glycosyltransferase family 4 protein [Opitutae bacterium]|jgi:glycosyltransferase involved in cell wall biosynthesis|nr:glycosyltransferase family 4 protein [Opitutae bacterium]
MKYIFINQNSNEKGGITTLSEHFHKFEPDSIILNLNADRTDFSDSRRKFVSADVSHRPDSVSEAISSMVCLLAQEQFLLIPNYGQIAHASVALVLAENKNCRILGIAHNNQEAAYEILANFSLTISQYIAVSKWVLRELSTRVSDKKINYLYPLTTTSPKPSVHDDDRSLRLIYASRLTNVDKEALRLIPLIKALLNVGLTFSLDIFGDGPCKNEIQKFLDTLEHVGSKITMHGDRPQKTIEKAFSKGDIFVSLSSEEGFGMAIAEAMSACLVPVIMRFNGGICEILKDGENSIMLEQKDFEGFAGKIAELSKDRQLLRKIKDNARKNIKGFQDEKFFFRTFREIAEACFREKRPKFTIQKVTSMDPMNRSLKRVVDKVKKRKLGKVNVFGGGLFGRRFIDEIRKFGVEIGCIYDSSNKENGKSYESIIYRSPNQLIDDNPIVVCSIESSGEIVNFLSALNVNRSRIIVP